MTGGNIRTALEPAQAFLEPTTTAQFAIGLVGVIYYTSLTDVDICREHRPISTKEDIMPRGPNGEVRPADMNKLAKCVVDLATKATSEEELKRDARVKRSKPKSRNSVCLKKTYKRRM